MAYIVRLPGLGMQQDRARLVEWHVDPGEQVTAGDLLVEVETEKATVDVEAKEDGVLRCLYAEVGDTRKPNQPLGIVAGPDEDISSLEASVDEEPLERTSEGPAGEGDTVEGVKDAVEGVGDDTVEGVGDTAERADATASVDTAAQIADDRMEDDDSEAVAERDQRETTRPRKITPRARKRAEELGVDLDALSDVEEPVTADDVEVVAAATEEKMSEAGVQAAETDVETAVGQAEAETQGMPDRITPRARKRAEELGVTLAGIEGTGPGGAVTEADVEDATEAGSERVAGDDRATGDGKRTLREERPLSEMRRTIATRLGQSYREAVHVTVNRAADAEALLSAVEASSRALETDVSMLDLLLVALSRALDEHPEFNATFEDETLSMYEEHNIGVAVDIDRGLVTPVVEGIGGKSLAEIATERRRLTERVLADEFSLGDLQGGTFTVTNLGPFGVESFDPVINPPQVAILGVNAIRERPVRNEDGTLGFRRELPLSLSFDHRVVDGADAARFLATLVDELEQPAEWVPEDVESDDFEGDGMAESEGERVSEEQDAGDREEMPGRSLTAEVEERLAGVVRGGSFEWSFDEPAELGGDGAAPTPVDYFLGSLAACLAASTRFQADKRDLDVEAIRVDVDGEPEHGNLESVVVTVGLRSNASDEDLAHIVELGERGCYVAATLREDLPVEVSWERL